MCLEYDLKFQNSEQKIDKTPIVEDYYNKLVSFGLKQSAYNLIFNNQLTADLGVSDKIKYNYSLDSSGYMIDGKQLYLNKNKPNWIK